MPDLNVNGTVVNNNQQNEYIPGVVTVSSLWNETEVETSQQKKQRIVQSVIEQLGQLDQQAQISVLRAVAAFYELEQDLSR
jgi:hypothetical protein